MMRDKKLGVRLSVGIPSIVTLLAVLCLFIMSILAFKAAQSEHTLALKTAQAQKNYYRAEAECFEKLRQIKAAHNQGDDELHALAGKLGVHTAFEQGARQLRFEQRIDYARKLCVLLEVGPHEIKTLRWQVEPSREWSPDQAISVWTGE